MDFTAVVLAAGQGENLQELISSDCPKAMISVGGYPMLWFPLKMLEVAGFQECYVIVKESDRKLYSTLVLSNLRLKPNYFSVPDDNNLETLGCLQRLKSSQSGSFKTNVLVLPVDVITDLPLLSVLCEYRLCGKSLMAVFASGSSTSNGLPVPGGKTKTVKNESFVVLKGNSKELVYYRDSRSRVRISGRLLAAWPQLTVRLGLKDAHIYLFETRLLNLPLPGELNSLRKDFVPWVAKGGLHGGSSETTSCCLFEYSAGPLLRANTSATLLQANRLSAQLRCRFEPSVELVDPGVKPAQPYQIGSSCIVGAESVLADKAVVKETVVGRGCHLGPKAKVTSSVLMDGAHIGESCVLINCIVGPRARIAAKYSLKDCFIGHSFNSLSDDCRSYNAEVLVNNLVELSAEGS